MLFGYPVTATSENWLHECVVQLLTEAHDRVERGAAATAWPDLLPTPYRSRLASRTGLGQRLAAYEEHLRGLTPDQRQILLRALGDQNAIASLLSNAAVCPRVDELPPAAIAPLESLFAFAFGLLTKLLTADQNGVDHGQSIRDRQYDLIFRALPARVCPFCGCERVDPPKRSIVVGDPAAREDLDHYLPRSLYPFAGANLRNLVPMGKKCNQSYKGSQDPIRTASGRRPAFDPYGVSPGLSIDLGSSDLFGNAGRPRWVMKLGPSSAELETWDALFDIERRWVESILDQEYNDWLKVFAGNCRRRHGDSITDSILVDELRLACETIRDEGYANLAFLKLEVFRVLLGRCAAGDKPLLTFLEKLVAASIAA